jgi:hypothetical protein
MIGGGWILTILVRMNKGVYYIPNDIRFQSKLLGWGLSVWIVKREMLVGIAMAVIFVNTIAPGN